MTIVRLTGGLGNQMFQYALGRRIAIARGDDLFLDTTVLDPPTPGRRHTPAWPSRHYALHMFDIRIAGLCADLEALDRLLPPVTAFVTQTKRGFHDEVFDYATPHAATHAATHATAATHAATAHATAATHAATAHATAATHAAPTPAQAAPAQASRSADGSERAIVLHGYWQSERYFCNIAGVLRNDLHFKRSDAYRERVLAATPGLTDPNAVCVHVRRTDYLKRNGAHIGFVGPEYYQQAAAVLATHVPNAHYYVFSDDLPWCRAELALAQPHTFVDYRALAVGALTEDTTELDFWAMTRCRHFILGNSTFSWWAAWLSNQPDATVIAPRRWYRDDDRCDFSRDVIPNRWTRI